MKSIFTLGLLLFFTSWGQAQERQYKILSVGFYNLENLFDTLDTDLVRDTEFTPSGRNLWNSEKYEEKIANMAYVISQIGIEKSPTGLSIIGVCEIENKQVLEDLVAHPLLESRNYKIVHHDSPDERGIDVALLYQANHFELSNVNTYYVQMFNPNGEQNFTRDMLLVSGALDQEEFHIMVNHWPSRSGGEQRSAPFRALASSVCRQAYDSLYQINPEAKVLVMGDLNDNPNNESLTTHLLAVGNAKKAKKDILFNPMMDMFKKGLGSNAYRDTWSLFDQIILSAPLLKNKGGGYYYHKASIYNPPYLRRASGQYKGYPKRTYAGGQYLGGYSDHFPVFVYLVKEI